MKTKVCTKCGVEKPLDQFYKDKRLKSGVHSECKVCHESMRRNWILKNREKVRKYGTDWIKKNPERSKSQQLKTRHGITLEDYNKLLKQQNGCCALCGHFGPRGNRQKYFHVDHDHNTGQIRGLLCCECNWFLGVAKLEDPEQIEKLLKYLKTSQRVLDVPFGNEGGN